MGRLVLLTLLGIGMLGAQQDAVAPEIELARLEKQLDRLWAAHKSISAQLVTSVFLDFGELSATSKGEGRFELLRDGNDTLVRIEQTSTTTTRQKDRETRTQQQLLTVIDARHTYVLSDVAGQRMALKSLRDPQLFNQPSAVLEILRKDYDLTLQPADQLNGRKVVVIEGATRARPLREPVRVTAAFDEATGVLVRLVYLGVDSRPIQAIAYTDLKVDEDLARDRFTFNPPDGVPVVDRTTVKD